MRNVLQLIAFLRPRGSLLSPPAILEDSASCFQPCATFHVVPRNFVNLLD